MEVLPVILMIVLALTLAVVSLIYSSYTTTYKNTTQERVKDIKDNPDLSKKIRTLFIVRFLLLLAIIGIYFIFIYNNDTKSYNISNNNFFSIQSLGDLLFHIFYICFLVSITLISMNRLVGSFLFLSKRSKSDEKILNFIKASRKLGFKLAFVTFILAIIFLIVVYI